MGFKPRNAVSQEDEAPAASSTRVPSADPALPLKSAPAVILASEVPAASLPSRFARRPTAQSTPSAAAPRRSFNFSSSAEEASSVDLAGSSAPSMPSTPPPRQLPSSAPSLSPRLERLLLEVARISGLDAPAQDVARRLAIANPAQEEARLLAIYQAAAPRQRTAPSLQALLRDEPSAIALELKKDGKPRIYRATGADQEALLGVLRGSSLESVPASETPFPSPERLFGLLSSPHAPAPKLGR
jgi:hypothetical protein